MKKLSYQLFFYISLLLFLCSMGLTFFDTPVGSTPGVFFIFGGFLYFLNDIVCFIAWFANITFFVSVFSFGKKKKKAKPLRTLIYSIITLVLGLVGMGIGKVDMETSSLAMKQAELGTGYYVWLLSFVLLVASMAIRYKHMKQ